MFCPFLFLLSSSLDLISVKSTFLFHYGSELYGAPFGKNRKSKITNIIFFQKLFVRNFLSLKKKKEKKKKEREKKKKKMI